MTGIGFCALVPLHLPLRLARCPVQAAGAYEAGLEAEPFNGTLKAGLQHAQKGLLHDLSHGRLLSRKALPAPPTTERITLAPHNAASSALLRDGAAAAAAAASSAQQHLLAPGQQYTVGWQKPTAELLCAAAAGQLGADDDQLQQQMPGGVGSCSNGVDGWRLPRVLLTPAAAAADPALKDVYEYVNTQVGQRLLRAH